MIINHVYIDVPLMIMVDNGWLYHVIPFLVDVRERNHQHFGGLRRLPPGDPQRSGEIRASNVTFFGNGCSNPTCIGYPLVMSK